MGDDVEYLTLQEVALAVKVSESTVRRWVRSGELAAFKVGGRGQIRVHPSDVRAFVERGRIEPTGSDEGETS